MTATDKAALAALQRYENDLLRLKDKRLGEKNQFYDNIELTNAQLSEQKRQNDYNMKVNQNIINNQREQASQAK